MHIKKIRLDHDEMPDRVTVELSLEEIIYIATLTGKHSHASADEVMDQGGELNHQVYSGFAAGLFNRFWEDGIDGARRGEKE